METVFDCDIQRLRGENKERPGAGTIVYDRPDASSQRMIIWRDRQSGTKILKFPSMDEEMRMEMDDLGNNEELVFAKFMRAHRCYDLIPISSKLVVFDTQLSVKKAFFALVYNGVRAAPLWDTKTQNFIGMLTITDFIKILHKYYNPSIDEQNSVKPPPQMDELENHTISKWREVLDGECPTSLINIGPDSSLFEAIEKLISNRVHRLLVVDSYSGNALYIMTHKRILRFLYLYIYELQSPAFMKRSICELKIGTFDKIVTAKMSTRMIEVLKLILEHRISALPIVDDDSKVIDLYSKFDVINLAAEKTYENLEITLGEVLTKRRETQSPEGVHRCLKTAALCDVMEQIVKAEVHRLVVVDEADRVLGVVSLSDILSFIVLSPVKTVTTVPDPGLEMAAAAFKMEDV